MKQTAVEWLADKMLTEHHSKIEWDKIVEQAKAMEKQQIVEAWNTKAKIDDVLTFTDNRTAEQYYKETYESKTNI